MRPKEVFLFGAKVGTDMAAILADSSVLISIALQHGISAKALALSVARHSETEFGPPVKPASVIGAVLDVITNYERGNSMTQIPVTNNFFASQTDAELYDMALKFAVAQEKLAADAHEDAQYWHHVALKELLMELAKRLVAGGHNDQ